MVAFVVRGFAGLRPSRNPDLLSPAEATVANNCRLHGGDLEPWRTPKTVRALSGVVKTIYRFGQHLSTPENYWFQSSKEVDFVRGPVPGDTSERTYWTGDGYPKKTDSSLATSFAPYPTNHYRLGIPAPTDAPSASVSGKPSDVGPIDPDDPESEESTSELPMEYNVYVVTNVTSWGEESGPSPASNTVEWQAGQTITLTIPPIPSGPYNVTHRRIYRSAAGSGTTAFHFVAQVGSGQTAWTDTISPDGLGEMLATEGWVPPPDSLFGLGHMANGVLYGFSGNTVYFTPPYIPYAFPVAYQHTVDADVIGGMSFGQSLYVSTGRSAYLFTGSDPEIITPELLSPEFICVSRRSMVQLMNGVVFATKDGLRYVGPAGAQLLTDGLLTEQEWAEYNPESMSCYSADGRCLVFYDTGAKRGGLVFTFGQEANMTTTDLYASAGFSEGRALYLFVDGSVVEWDAGSTYMTAKWRSQQIRTSQPINLACARVDAETYPVTFRLYADGVLKYTKVVPDNWPFRLPGGFQARRHQMEVETNDRVMVLSAATTMQELRSSG